MVIQALPEMPFDEIVLRAYEKQVALFKPMSEDFAHFKRQDPGSEDGTYAWLYKAVNRYL